MRSTCALTCGTKTAKARNNPTSTTQPLQRLIARLRCTRESPRELGLQLLSSRRILAPNAAVRKGRDHFQLNLHHGGTEPRRSVLFCSPCLCASVVNRLC